MGQQRVQHFIALRHVHAIFIHTLFIHNVHRACRRLQQPLQQQQQRQHNLLRIWETSTSIHMWTVWVSELSCAATRSLVWAKRKKAKNKRKNNNCQFQVNCLFTLLIVNREIAGAITWASPWNSMDSEAWKYEYAGSGRVHLHTAYLYGSQQLS